MKYILLAALVLSTAGCTDKPTKEETYKELGGDLANIAVLLDNMNNKR